MSVSFTYGQLDSSQCRLNNPQKEKPILYFIVKISWDSFKWYEVSRALIRGLCTCHEKIAECLLEAEWTVNQNCNYLYLVRELEIIFKTKLVHLQCCVIKNLNELDELLHRPISIVGAPFK